MIEHFATPMSLNVVVTKGWLILNESFRLTLNNYTLVNYEGSVEGTVNSWTVRKANPLLFPGLILSHIAAMFQPIWWKLTLDQLRLTSFSWCPLSITSPSSHSAAKICLKHIKKLICYQALFLPSLPAGFVLNGCPTTASHTRWCVVLLTSICSGCVS